MHHVKSLLYQSVARVVLAIGLQTVLLASVKPSDFGIYTGCLATASIIAAGSCLGFDRVLLLADPHECRALRNVCALSALVLGAAAGAMCWLVCLKFATPDAGRPPIDAAGQWAIGLNGLLQSTGTATLLCRSQLLIREGRVHLANLCLSLPSTLVLGAQVIGILAFGSSVSSLAAGATAGWIAIFLVVSHWSVDSSTMQTAPVRAVLQRWWKPALIRVGTGTFANARTQLGYLVLFFSTPIGTELLAAVRVFDMAGSTVSAVLERSWGMALASIRRAEGKETFEAESNALIDEFARWIRKLSVFCLLLLGVATFAGKYLVPDRWSFVIQVAPPLVIAVAIAAQMAWLEKLFEYQRRFKDGLWTEAVVTVTLLASCALLLPLATSLTAGAWIFGGIYATTMVARGHASMKRGVSRATSEGLLKITASVALLAGLIVWAAQVLP